MSKLTGTALKVLGWVGFHHSALYHTLLVISNYPKYSLKTICNKTLHIFIQHTNKRLILIQSTRNSLQYCIHLPIVVRTVLHTHNRNTDAYTCNKIINCNIIVILSIVKSKRQNLGGPRIEQLYSTLG